MRVAIVAESFLPNVNGVVNSVLRVLEHLRRTGHEALVIAPGARDGQPEIFHYEGFRIARVPTVEIPGINSLPVGVPLPRVLMEMSQFKPDVVHLASPFVLGGAGALAAKALNVPCVAVYQTDVAGFAHNYKAKALSNMAWHWTRGLHNRCSLTLAPSSVTIEELEKHHVRNVFHWGRGVDAVRFHPAKRDPALREAWLREGQRLRERHAKADAERAGRTEPATTAAPQWRERKLIGFVGRLAAEKSVEHMAALNGCDDLQIVIIGDGPEASALKKLMPTAVFTGGMYGEDLPRGFASLDVFVHSGQFETFCQAVQEAQASGLPSIAPAAGGPVDLITPGVNGYLLDVATFERDLPSAVRALVGPEHEALRSNARAAIHSKTWERLCDQLLGYYHLAISRQLDGGGTRDSGQVQRALGAGRSTVAPHSTQGHSTQGHSPQGIATPAGRLGYPRPQQPALPEQPTRYAQTRAAQPTPQATAGRGRVDGSLAS